MARVAHAVDEGLRACGLQPDEHGASASNPLFARPLSSWRAAARQLSEDPTREKALILVSVISDSRPLWGCGPGADGPGADGPGADGPGAEGAGVSVADQLWQARGHPDLQRLLARFALQFRPPTGF